MFRIAQLCQEELGLCTLCKLMTTGCVFQVGHLREVSNKTHNAELKLFLEVEFGPVIHSYSYGCYNLWFEAYCCSNCCMKGIVFYNLLLL